MTPGRTGSSPVIRTIIKNNINIYKNLMFYVSVMELVDMLFSEGSGSSRTGSTPVTRTIFLYISHI